MRDIIVTVSERTGIDESIVEKDYYVTMILKELVQRNPNVVFKGGTSLSKAYHVIDRFSGTHYKAILFDNNILFSNSVDSGDHPCNTVCIYSINDKTIETISFDQYYPLDLAVWDNILIVSHFDLVKREGGSISIYNLETKELNNIELGHDVEQMTINENVIYILSDKIIYQYELKDMNLYLKCKTQIKKSNEENYLSGIFYIKPESMKFTL